jgi:hypothetical protein
VDIKPAYDGHRDLLKLQRGISTRANAWADIFLRPVSCVFPAEPLWLGVVRGQVRAAGWPPGAEPDGRDGQAGVAGQRGQPGQVGVAASMITRRAAPPAVPGQPINAYAGRGRKA